MHEICDFVEASANMHSKDIKKSTLTWNNPNEGALLNTDKKCNNDFGEIAAMELTMPGPRMPSSPRYDNRSAGSAHIAEPKRGGVVPSVAVQPLAQERGTARLRRRLPLGEVRIGGGTSYQRMKSNSRYLGNGQSSSQTVISRWSIS